MFKKLRLHIVLSIIAIAWIMYADSVREKPINWYPSFNAKHKIPYGTYALRNLLPEFIQPSRVIEVNQPPFTKLKDTTFKGTYFFVNNVINFGKEEFNELLKFVDRGNDVFVSTLGANVDTLHLETRRINSFTYKGHLKLQLKNPNLDTLPVGFKNDLTKFGFSSIDSSKTEILGTVKLFDKEGDIHTERINFVRQKYGKGYFYFHLYPHALTNFYILKDSNRAYAESILSYIDQKKPLYWDAYYKTGKSRITSPMHYILSSKKLKWAYYVALIGLLIFVLFQGKRNQRYIPIITPLSNQTIAFTKTISNLYFEKKDHHTIAKKHIFFFLNFIRTELQIDTSIVDEPFYEKLSLKSGNSIEEIKSLFQLIQKIDNQNKTTKEQLITLNTKIEYFKRTLQSA